MALPLAWLVGVAVQLHERELWPRAAYVAIAASAVLLALAGVRARRGFAVVVAAALAAGCAVSGGQAPLRRAESLPSVLEGRDIVVTGVVASLPQQGPSGLRFRFALDDGGAPAGVPSLLALGWYAGYDEDAARVQPRQSLRAGQRWRFTVRLRQPHGNLNPNRFDYELALIEQGVRATGYVRDAPATLLDTSAGYPVERLRQRVRDAIYLHVEESSRRRRARGARDRRSGRDRTRRLGSVSHHRRRPPEAALVASLGPALSSDVLVVPHHGSKTDGAAEGSCERDVARRRQHRGDDPAR